MPEFFKSALAALPSAAQNPLAFMAYVMVIVSATIIALKAKRNQQLLNNLEKLPPEDRLKALELEMEAVRVPPNLTAEQWLKARTQRYYFVGFALVCLTLLIVFALAVATREKKDPGSVDVTLGALPDMDSSIIVQWGTPRTAQARHGVGWHGRRHGALACSSANSGTSAICAISSICSSP